MVGNNDEPRLEDTLSPPSLHDRSESKAKTLPRAPFSRGNDLMRYRVREVLLVSSLYEAFILQEDGNLYDQLSAEFEDLRLSSAPVFAHATSAKDALVALDERHFDLLLVMPRLLDMDFVEFACMVKERHPDCAVVTLHFDSPGLRQRTSVLRKVPVDGMFVWTGDAKIYLAIIKYIEDKKNLVSDIEIADVRVLLVVEDSIRYWSAFLANLYPILMKQSQDLIADGLNDAQRLTRMRTRSKIILVNNYNEAVAFWERFRDNVLGVISDVGYERNGDYKADAGLDFIRMVRSHDDDLPVLLQSAEDRYRAVADGMGVTFVNKNSPTLMQETIRFMRDQLGFGDFVFRLPTGEEVARAHDLRELEQCLHSIPDESLEYHVRRNHFSNWLMARSEFELASRLRPARIEDFNCIAEVRNLLISGVKAARRQAGRGSIVDSMAATQDEVLFERIGRGSLGGKGRGIAFLAHLISDQGLETRFSNMTISVPQTFVVASNVFDEFMEMNGLHRVAYDSTDDEIIEKCFLAASFPAQIERSLRRILERVSTPLAVRSSSLLEDSMYTPFAGIYKTVMISNNTGTLDERVRELVKAIKLVYASTFFQNAKGYIKTTPFRVEEEKMAVVIQRLVGRSYGEYFYPICAGAALSYNYYPVGSVNSEDGVATIAFGMGRMVVDGGTALRFCPRHPTVLPHLSSPRDIAEHAQREFFALRLGSREFGPDADGMIRLPVSVAEEHGSLQLVASIYDPRDEMIFEMSSIRKDGEKVITFADVLKRNRVPLAPMISEVLQLTRYAMGTHVEIEFACEGWAHGSLVDGKPVFHILQVRPIVVDGSGCDFTADSPDMAAMVPESEVRPVIASSRALGHGNYGELRDLVMVTAPLNPQVTPRAAADIDRINASLEREGRGYVLVGPGRWGTSQPGVGIPVKWSQISGAHVIVEVSPEGSRIEPSQGSHFFHNMTAMRIGYMTVAPGSDLLDMGWVLEQQVMARTEHVLHVRVETPLIVQFDGRTRRARIAVKP